MIGRRIEHQQRHPLPTIFGNVTKHSPHGIGVLEIVLGNQFFIEALTLKILDEAHRDFLEQHRLSRSSGDRTVAQMNSHAPT